MGTNTKVEPKISRGRGFAISKRDERLLTLLYEQQFLTTTLLFETVFPGVDKSYLYKRLRTLEKQNIITWTKHLLKQLGGLLRLTNYGLELATSLAPRPVDWVSRPSTENLIHDTIVTTVRIHLERNLGGKWRPEYSLADAGLPHRPDGLFIPTNSHFVIAIEVENSTKSRNNFFEKARTWHSCEFVDYVLYVATNTQIKRILEQRILEITDNKKFIIRGLDEIKTAAKLDSLLGTEVRYVA